MKDEPVKKSIFARINEALYETVETEGQAELPEPTEPVGRKTAARAAAVGDQQPVGSPTDIAARVKADIAARGPAFTQFLALVASFTEIIAEESGRYRAAMKALEKTGNVSRDQVLLAGKDQLLALESQREVFVEAVGRKREVLRQSSGGAEAIRAQIAELQQQIGRLQQEEQALLKSAAAEEGKLKAAEEGFAALLGALEKEIVVARDKIKNFIPG